MMISSVSSGRTPRQFPKEQVESGKITYLVDAYKDGLE